MQLITKRGYDFYEASSTLQKSIRRGDTKLAGYFALELLESNYPYYVWRRLLTISAEDCYNDTITTEVYNLYRSFVLINENQTKPKGRIFLSKAIIILCRTPKNRDADHLQNFIYDDKQDITDEEIKSIIDRDLNDREEVPEYCFDIHTKRGRYLKKTKTQFFVEEFDALAPRQKGLFDNTIARLKN